MRTTRTRRHYDHRLRRLVEQNGDLQLAVRNNVPRSTARDERIRNHFGEIWPTFQEALFLEILEETGGFSHHSFRFER